MKRIHHSWLSLAILLLLLSSQGLCAQSSSQTSGQQAAPAPAQSQPPSSPPPPPKKKPKKVWTNEDVGGITGGVSVVGDSSPGDPAKARDRRAHGQANASTVTAFRKELQNLHGQLDQVEKQSSDLRNFKADNTSPSGGLKMTGRYNMVPLEEQIRQLEQKRNQIQARIDDVEDQARKMGIEPGDLR